MALGTTMSWRADTLVAIDLIHTGGPKGTRGRLALIDVYPAVRPSKTRGTFAPVPVVSVHTGPAVVTRVRTAVVGILSTNRPLPAFFADTGEGVAIDHAGASIMTGVRQAATVSSYITGCSFPATRTHALKRIHFIIAGATVITRGFVTLAVTRVAGFPFPPIFAVTVKVIDQVSTCTPIVARVLATVIYVVLTVRALPAVTTDTLVGVNTVDARATVFTGVALTVVDIFMAVGAGEAFVTVTGEFAARLALALPMGTTDVGRDIPHPFRRIVGGHGHSAAVNHFTGSGAAVVFQV